MHSAQRETLFSRKTASSHGETEKRAMRKEQEKPTDKSYYSPLLSGDLINLRHRVCSPLSLYLFCSSFLPSRTHFNRLCEQLFNVTAFYIFFYAPCRVSPALSGWENSRDNKIKCERKSVFNKRREELFHSIHLFR